MCVQRDEDSKGGAAFGMRGFLGDRCLVCGEAVGSLRWIFMIIAVCDPKGIAIEAIKTILYHDKGLSDRISRIYEFWNMEQLLDASRDSSFDCIVFPNYCNSHNSL